MLTLVVGAGYTGSRLLARLPDAIGLSRSSGFDLDRAPLLPVDLPERYQLIYTVPPSDGDLDERLQHFLTLMEPAPQRFVYISTTGVYGDCRGELVSEDSPLRPSSQRAERRVAAEQQLEQWRRASGSQLTVLRTPGIYGPGRLGIERLHNKQILESQANPANRIHVDDLVSCCIAALTAAAGIYNVGDGNHRSATWFANEVARQTGRAAPEQISRQAAADEFSPRRLSFLNDSRRVDTRKMRETLGVKLRYANAADGITASLDPAATG